VPETPLPTPTQRVIDAASRKGVTLDVHTFTESTHTAEDAAAAVGAALGQIVKSLVFVAPRTDGGLEPILCLVSGPNRVDVARLAAVTGEPDVRRATAVEARDLTGYTIGGIPPVGFPRPLRVVMDPDLGRFQVVWAAAGTATAVFPVAPATLRMLSNAHVAPICEERRQADVLAEGAGIPGAGLESADLESADLQVQVPRDTAPGDTALPQPGGRA
jgi:prolyl-tRNA editing enzyme YbaK/EbsC (Cys-tRNA(Pro) deacylase)